MNTLKRQKIGLFSIGVWKRSLIIWLGFQLLLWTVFAITYFFHLDSWQQVDVHSVSNPDSLTSTFFYILLNNLFLSLLIVIGNLFVRFGVITPGMFVLLIQALLIGVIAGSNSFEFPFASVAEANWQYLKVGLWETTAYALICAVTLPKSLYISDTFPAKKWSQVRALKEIPFNKTEKMLIIVSVGLLVMAAWIEAILLA